MELTGQLKGISLEFGTRKPCINLVVNENIDGIEELDGKDLRIRIVKATRPRSLDANAYFHVLCDRLRMKLGVSMAKMKNMLITSYGQIEYISEGQALIYKTNAPPEYIEELEEAHMKFLKQGEDGAYWYKVYRGSHTYDSAEMHLLLEGTIREAKEQGIETMTPDEIRRLEMLEVKKGEKNDTERENP